MTFLILAFATWRISSMIVNECGPFHIFVWMRELFGIKHDDVGVPMEHPDNFFGILLSCVWCASVWVGFAIYVFYIICPLWTFAGCTILALSTGAILIDKIASVN